MGYYMAFRIIDKAYTYDYVISKRPDLKASIDETLIANGRSDLITGYVPPTQGD